MAVFPDRTTPVVLLSLFVFMQIFTNAQIFVDEGLERGVEAVIFTNGFSAPGVSAIDFDQDGDDDLTIGSNGEVLFYRNNNDGFFQLIDLGIENPTGELQSLIWTDINNDGNLDLMLTSYFSQFKLYKNIGDMEFEDITETCGISSEIAANWGISFSDVNRDGFVDLQLCRYESFDIIAENPSVNPELWTRFYINNGDETFTDYTSESGLVIEPAPVFLGVFFDFNNDLWPDNYTIIDRTPGNRLFVNNEGEFDDITDEYGVSYSGNDIMSNSIADYNNDGYLDIFMTNDAVSTFLLKNNGGESFTNVAASAGVNVDIFGWGAVWIDANNNGWQDLFFATPSYAHNYFFLNDEGTFTQEELEMQLEDVPSFSAAKGDFDNDGFYDLIIQSQDPDRSPLLMNQANDNKFIKITPHGTISNTMAIGSWIKVYAAGNEYVHYTLCGEGFISQNSQHLIFGLGAETTLVDSVTIWYPSGHTDAYFDLAVDSSYHFYEGETFQFDIQADETQACEGEQIELDAGQYSSYLWSTGDTTRFISVDTSGIYFVSVVNMFGISSTSNLDVEFFPNPITTATVFPNACRGDSTAAISLENLVNTAVDSVLWSNGMSGDTIDSLSSGVYSYIYTDVNGCASSGTVSVIDPQELLVLANGNPADFNENNGSIDVMIFGGVAPYTVVMEGDTVNVSIEGLPSGVYIISVTDAYGCAVSVEVIVDSTLGTSRNDLPKGIAIYPNLIQSGEHVKLGLDINVAKLIFKIRNVQGEIVQENEFRDLVKGQHDLSLSNFSRGIYIYELVIEEELYSGKLIIQ